ncbi:MAG: TIGR00159 family protein [Dehalococcoidia bacterium]|nr:TIGR00159 family protein [Dehalococcoidia bacterium]|tara:strand:+ start:2595 stop:3422 length:828 start_codon:yes stop_codon:yes gene_type:complete
MDFQQALEVLNQFDWSAAIDVLLIAVAIFAAFRLLSRTRAITLLRGAVALILVLVILGLAFDLTAVNWILENGLVALIVGAAVIFQPEIRRGLDLLGRTGIQDLLAHDPTEDTIDAVAEAATRMALKGHGALIVFERETGLQDVVEMGVSVDARVSTELIEGIFFPNSPLHDMATVVRGARVVAASCELPLADEVRGGVRRFGTRHRAAVGITEQTDALSVVVSEETGEISVCQGGLLDQVERGTVLAQELHRRLVRHGEDGSGSPAGLERVTNE